MIFRDLKRISGFTLLILLASGCSAAQAEPHPLSWWLLGGLGLIVIAAAIASLVGARRLKLHLDRLETDVSQRSIQIDQQAKELTALYRADDELRRHLHIDDVLQSLVDTAVELLHADKGSLMIWDHQREKLVVRASHGFHPDTVARMSFKAGEGLAGKVALSGEPAIVEDTLENGRITPFIVEAENLRALMQVPIWEAGRVFGVFSADYLQPHHFTDAEKRLLLAFAQRAGLAIENARMYEYEQKIAVMEERNRLARDLHDSMTQSLYAVTLYSEVAAQLLKNGELEKASHHMQELKELSLDALSEMRLLIYELRPSVFEHEGLVAAIQARLDSVEERVGLKTSFTIQGEIELPDQVESGIYRITQEALNNVLKHAHAKHVNLNLTQEDHLVLMEITDDGIGFDPHQECEAGCQGLRNMQERAQELCAEIDIFSQLGGGTKIILRRQTS